MVNVLWEQSNIQICLIAVFREHLISQGMGGSGFADGRNANAAGVHLWTMRCNSGQ